MNRWIIILLLGGLLLGSVSVPRYAVEGSAEAKTAAVRRQKKAGEEEKVVIVKKKRVLSEKWHRYRAISFQHEEKSFRLELYTTAETDESGELLSDDRAAFQIRLVTGKKQYLFLKESIQLGVPDADVFTDKEELLHIVVRDVRTAQYKITDYVYDAQKKQFTGTDIICCDGINVIYGMNEK